MSTILYVEDDLVLAKTVERMLGRIAPDARVIHLLSVDAAIKVLGLVRVDLVLSDFNVFGPKTGLDLLEHVVALHIPTPFIFLSSDERCEGRGVPWLRKPCPPSHIRDAVMAVLDPPKVVMEVSHA